MKERERERERRKRREESERDGKWTINLPRILREIHLRFVERKEMERKGETRRFFFNFCFRLGGN